MTENEWLACATPNSLLYYLRPWSKHRRKLHLYICASCRQSWKLFNDPCRQLIEKIELFAFNKVSATEVLAAKRAVTRQAKKEWAETGSDGLAEIGPGLLKELRLEHLSGWEGIPPPPKFFFGTNEQWLALEAMEAACEKMLITILRDIFGNPFSPGRVEATWFTDDIRSLARATFAQRRLPEGYLERDRLSALADALEAVGCTDPNLVEHLREPGPHFLGCWVVELLGTESQLRKR